MNPDTSEHVVSRIRASSSCTRLLSAASPLPSTSLTSWLTLTPDAEPLAEPHSGQPGEPTRQVERDGPLLPPRHHVVEARGLAGSSPPVCSLYATLWDMRVEETDEFRRWIDRLTDKDGRARILVRIDRLVHGNPGSHRNLTDGISELRIDFGPGYRVYYALQGSTLLLLLAGGDKSSQQRDIAAARSLKRSLLG